MVFLNLIAGNYSVLKVNEPTDSSSYQVKYLTKYKASLQFNAKLPIL